MSQQPENQNQSIPYADKFDQVKEKLGVNTKKNQDNGFYSPGGKRGVQHDPTGEWAIIYTKGVKEDEDNEFAELYYLPSFDATVKQNQNCCVLHASAIVPDTMMPNGEYMRFSTDQDGEFSILLENVRSGEKKHLKLKDLKPK